MKCIDCGDELAGEGFGVNQETIITNSNTTNNNNNTNTNTTNNNNNINTEASSPSPSDVTKKQKQEALEERFQRRTCSSTNKSTISDLSAQIIASNQKTSSLRLLPSIFLCQQHLVNSQHAHQSIIHLNLK